MSSCFDLLPIRRQYQLVEGDESMSDAYSCHCTIDREDLVSDMINYSYRFWKDFSDYKFLLLRIFLHHLFKKYQHDEITVTNVLQFTRELSKSSNNFFSYMEEAGESVFDMLCTFFCYNKINILRLDIDTHYINMCQLTFEKTHYCQVCEYIPLSQAQHCSHIQSKKHLNRMCLFFGGFLKTEKRKLVAHILSLICSRL